MSTAYDFSRIGKARREAVAALDDYGCTVAEQRAMFRVTESTFHRYAEGVRLRRRPSHRLSPGCRSERRYDRDSHDDPPMPRADSLEIATIALIRSRSRFSVSEIVQALKTSKSAVYRQQKAYHQRRGDLSPVEQRWRHRHLPSHLTDYLSPAERAREVERRYRRWVSRPRRQSN